MIVTINTDASFSLKHQLGTYAFWIVCNEGKIAKSGVLRKKVKRPEVAEFRCIINALYVLICADFKDITKVIINTDCLNVIHLAQKKEKLIKKYGLYSWGQHLVLQMEIMIMKSKLRRVEIEFRHVKSHESTETARQWVNEWCDSEAKKQLRNEIIKLNKVENQ